MNDNPAQDFVDWVVVERVLTGHGRPGRPLTLAERREVVLTGTAQGLTDNAIAKRLHTRASTVRRLRTEAQTTEVAA